MKLPIIAQNHSYKVDLEPGTYWWCACGQSISQPFCDVTHKNCDITPVEFTIETKKIYSICGCKHSKKIQFCDGTHRDLVIPESK